MTRLSKAEVRFVSAFFLLKILFSAHHISQSVPNYMYVLHVNSIWSTYLREMEELEETVADNRERCDGLERYAEAIAERADEEEMEELEATKKVLAECRRSQCGPDKELEHRRNHVESRQDDLAIGERGEKLIGENLKICGIQLLFRASLAYSFYAKKLQVLRLLFFVTPFAMYFLNLYYAVSDVWDLSAIFCIPISDHVRDHRMLFPPQEEFAGMTVYALCYLAHVYFFFLIKKRIDCLSADERQQEEVEDWRTQERRSRRRPPPPHQPKRRGRVAGPEQNVKKSIVNGPATKPPDHSWFFHACLYGHKEVIKNLLKDSNFDINVKCVNSINNSGLHIAVLAGEVSAVQILLDNQHHRVDLQAENEEGKTALEMAVEMGRLDMVNKITSAKGFKWRNVDVNKLLVLSIQHDRHQVAEKLLQSPKFDTSDKYLVSCIERWVELSEEVDRGETPDAKRQDNEKSLSTYRGYICDKLSAGKVVELPSNKRVRHLVEDYFECPVCCEDMIGEGVRIFSCSNDHWMCPGCLHGGRLASCPICREDFTIVAPMRCLLAERIACQIKL